MTFHEHSKQIVEDYLGTVAYVDDLIYSANTEVQAKNLGSIDIKEEAAKTKTELKKDIIEEQIKRNIDPLTFTNSFLVKGIHCALIEVKDDKKSLEPIKKILNKSDVVILDWQMHHDSGSKATKLLLSVLEDIANIELRLIIIYTEEPNYTSILPDNILPELKKNGLNNGALDKSNCKYQHGHTKIVVLKKRNGEKTDYMVSDEELPDRIIEEFTEITEGLVSNTALKAVSVIRKNSHRLLGAFNKGLDSAYLAHRAMLPIPKGAEALVKETIVDSINSIISYSNINEACSIEIIKEWLNSNDAKVKKINIGTGKNKIEIEVSKDDLIRWQEIGYSTFFHSIVKKQTKKDLKDQEFNAFDRLKLKDKASICFSQNGNTPEGSSEEFAVLTHHKSNFKIPSYIPYLTLGVIVQSGGDYFLCIQQKCDSLRIGESEERNFMFLPLNENGSFPIVFKDDKSEYITLKVNVNNCHHLLIEKFKQTVNGIVQSNFEKKDYFFEDSNGKKYKWILDLKESHAQRIANKFAAQISRVGLDESEWLRRGGN